MHRSMSDAAAGTTGGGTISGERRDSDPPITVGGGVRDRKQSVHLRLDREVFDFFKADGRGHISRMQAVLRAHVEAHRRSGR